MHCSWPACSLPESCRVAALVFTVSAPLSCCGCVTLHVCVVALSDLSSGPAIRVRAMVGGCLPKSTAREIFRVVAAGSWHRVSSPVLAAVAPTWHRIPRSLSRALLNMDLLSWWPRLAARWDGFASADPTGAYNFPPLPVRRWWSCAGCSPITAVGRSRHRR